MFFIMLGHILNIIQIKFGIKKGFFCEIKLIKTNRTKLHNTTRRDPFKSNKKLKQNLGDSLSLTTLLIFSRVQIW